MAFHVLRKVCDSAPLSLKEESKFYIGCSSGFQLSIPSKFVRFVLDLLFLRSVTGQKNFLEAKTETNRDLLPRFSSA